NITPMLDLAYVLLVIFVIMTTATVQGMKVNLPKASPAKSLAKPTTKAITVTQDGKLFLDTFPVTMQELEQRLIQQRAVTPEFPVVVRGDGMVQYQSVVDVLDLLARLNITTVGLATKPLTKSRVPAQAPASRAVAGAAGRKWRSTNCIAGDRLAPLARHPRGPPPPRAPRPAQGGDDHRSDRQAAGAAQAHRSTTTAGGEAQAHARASTQSGRD